ncbi:MAG: ROK family protein [Candidatus Firestonebacteria bacterium]
MSKENFAIGVDLGGTNTVAGLVSSKGRVLFKEKLKTEAHKGKNSIIHNIERAIQLVIARATEEQIEGLKGIGIGSPGLVDPRTGIVREPPNLKGWKAVPLAKIISRKFKLPAYIGNDANVYALGEHTFGAGKGADSMVCITLGTGMGGGLILNGQLYVGSFFTAGELGHVIIDKAGLKCNCGNIGCVERYVGNSFIIENALNKLKAGKKSIIAEISGGTEHITPITLELAAKKGDKLALEIWKETGEYIGAALSSIINTLGPRLVVVGGGVSKAGPLLLDPIRKEVKKRVFKYLGKRVKIVPGKLGDNAAVLGAASLVWHHL